MLKENLEQMKKDVLEKINLAKESKALEDIRVEILGKKGKITEILKGLKDLSDSERKEVGKIANEVKNEIESSIDKATAKLEELAIESEMKKENFDISMPGIEIPTGSLHPVTLVQKEVEEIFKGMGFSIVDGPEVETDYYNFKVLKEKLNQLIAEFNEFRKEDK